MHEAAVCGAQTGVTRFDNAQVVRGEVAPCPSVSRVQPMARGQGRSRKAGGQVGEDGVAVRLTLQVRPHVLLDLLRPPVAGRLRTARFSIAPQTSESCFLLCATASTGGRPWMVCILEAISSSRQRLNRDSAAQFRRESAQHNMPRTPSSKNVHVFPCSRLV